MKFIIEASKQREWLDNNWRFEHIAHKWSTRGYGSSRILDARGNLIARATGCGYDRFGSALGEFIIRVFPAEVHALAKRKCNGRRRTYKQSKTFYGLFYNSKTDKAWLDGACGSSCMERILEAIGFRLVRVGECEHSNSGTVFYSLQPAAKSAR